MNSFDREKVVDCMFDPVTSEILAELEDGEKECSFLAEQESQFLNLKFWKDSLI